MRKRKGTRPATGLDYLSDFMPGLQLDRKHLTEIQSAYDNLTLLGQLLCAGTDITGMREDFGNLAKTLLEQLANEHYRKAQLSLTSNARVAIDVLTRNLYERTADIGFLATDVQIRTFAQGIAEQPQQPIDSARYQALLERFAEYVDKYSVYHNIILLSPTGTVLAQLDADNAITVSRDSLLDEALNTTAAYVESFRPTDLLPGDNSPLVYAYRVMSADNTHPVGVLCLCFRFHDECRRVFDSLVGVDDWTVITLLDSENRVIASSDPYQIPVGATMEAAPDGKCHVTRFAGREYLASTQPTQPYQGYAGPGWVGQALAPLEHAFEMSVAHELEHVPEDFLNCILETASLFSPELKGIPLNAAQIQSELNRAVWNGHVWLGREANAAQSAAFAKVLLREIGSTGVRTRNVFSESITNLYKTVVSSVLFDCGTQAALAIDLMDRNLYERANDCRWWALTQAFEEELQNPDSQDKAQRQRLTEVLRRINGLYTVYSNLILFTSSGQVLAVSNPAYNDHLGKTLNEPWVRTTLGLPETRSYAVSGFVPSKLYDGRPTYIFSAAVRAPTDHEPVGGIAIVFDAAPQFHAMLTDALPRQADGSPIPGAFAVFAERNGRVIASTDPQLVPGEPLMIGYEFFNQPQGESCTNAIIYNGRYYAVGSTMSAGYREYKTEYDSHRNDVVALVFSPLSDQIINGRQVSSLRDTTADTYARQPVAGSRSIDLACFHIGQSWYGIRTSQVVEAVDPERLTPMPGLPDSVCGCLMYDDQAISVIDLAPLLANRRATEERRSGAGQVRRQIVILDSPEHRLRFGLLVDQLGAVREIPLNRIEPLPDMMSEGNSLIESLVKPLSDEAERRILIVLSVQRILQRLGRAISLPQAAWLPAMLNGD
ncbi:MAG: chemotaxis protein CheW [Betaproteobacteria bacterium]|nr:chemotaxis protein CheW [Betaproteobacteria bacterium]